MRHYAEDLGFEYMCAETKEEYLDCIDNFLTTEQKDHPVLFEVFTDSKNESDALYTLYHIEVSTKTAAKNAVKNVLGEKGVATLKKIMGK